MATLWAIEHLARRLDGKVREQLELTPNHNLKIRYESYEEARAELLEEGINSIGCDVTDMRVPEARIEVESDHLACVTLAPDAWDGSR